MSLQRRIVIAFSVFSAIVAGLATLLVHGLVHQMEDRVVERQLEVESEHARRLVEAGKPFGARDLYRYYVGRAALPAELREVAELSPGTHELDTEVHEAHVRIVELGRGERLYVLYIEDEDPFGDWLQLAFGGLALVIFIAGVALGLFTARRIARPLAEVAGLVSTTPPHELVAVLPGRRYDAEVQGVIDRLVASLQARDEFAAREQRFTSFASHELRTPVAVIKGAAELLRTAPEATEPRVRRPLERIERAAVDMQSTIEALLWLARDPSTVDAPARIAVLPVVERVVEKLPKTKPIEVVIERRAELSAKAPAGVLEMAIGNLVGNAYHFTERGTITVAIEDSSIAITDDGPGMSATELDRAGTAFARGPGSAGYGLGLAIVKTICARFGWTLALEPSPGRGLRATLQLS